MSSTHCGGGGGTEAIIRIFVVPNARRRRCETVGASIGKVGNGLEGRG